MRKNAFALVAVAIAASCGSFSSPERTKLANDFYDNAHTYYRGRDYRRSTDQITRGLEVDPDHYKLNQLQGKVLLQQARSNQELFTQALEVFQRVRGLRGDHDYELTLDIAQAQQGLYFLHRRKAKQLRAESLASGLSATERTHKLAKADENRKLALDHMNEAAREYKALIDAKDLGVFPAMERLFLLEIDRAYDLEGEARTQQLRRAAKIGEKYLEQNDYRQKHYKVMVDITSNALQEREGRRRVREFRRREVAFRREYGRVLFELEDWKAAAKELDRILDVVPTSADDYLSRARCRAKLGQTTEAKRDIEHFLRLTKKPFESREVREAHALQSELDKS